MEIRLLVHDTTGVLRVYINGNAETAQTNIDTRNGGASGVIDTLAMGATQVTFASGQHNWFMDDLYIMDTTGSTNNDNIGDVKVETLFPSADGNSSQFVGSDGNSTSNYLLVDDGTSHDSDTTYVESATVGNKDTYTYANLASPNGTVYGVQISPIAKKTDVSPRTSKTIARLSSTEVDGAAATLTTAYLTYPDIRETKPGGGAWTITDVNNAEFGVKVDT